MPTAGVPLVTRVISAAQSLLPRRHEDSERETDAPAPVIHRLEEALHVGGECASRRVLCKHYGEVVRSSREHPPVRFIWRTEGRSAKKRACKGGFFCLLAACCCLADSAWAQLTAADVQRVINQATRRANKIAPNSVIAVTNREGYVLGVWSVRGGEPGLLEIAGAVSKAGTASFLSSNANAFTSRTAGFIIQQHFPPGVRNLPPGPLVGVGFSNLPFSDVNRFKKADFIPGSASPGTLGSPIAGTSLSGIPGGVPLLRMASSSVVSESLVRGIEFPPTTFVSDYSKDEDIALAGQQGFAPSSAIFASNVFIAGISLPYVESTAGSTSGAPVTGNAAAGFDIIGSPPPFPYPTATFAGVSGQIRQPIIGDPLPGTINGQARLTQAEVEGIVRLAADRVRTTRAGIRLPIGSRMEVFITVVNNPNMPGVGPTVLAAFRTGDGTIFSWDVAVQKGRTAVGFSDTRTRLLHADRWFPRANPLSAGDRSAMGRARSTVCRRCSPVSMVRSSPIWSRRRQLCCRRSSRPIRGSPTGSRFSPADFHFIGTGN